MNPGSLAMSTAEKGGGGETKSPELHPDKEKLPEVALVPVPIWRNGAYAGQFGDAYIEDTELEGGQVLQP